MIAMLTLWAMIRRAILNVAAWGSVGLFLAAPTAWAQPTEAAPYRADACSIEGLINQQYAYLDRFPEGRIPLSDKLRAQCERVDDRDSLIRYAERVLLTLADHHAITGSSLPDSWAVVPSFADLWIETRGPHFFVESVKDDSPADRADIRPGDRILELGGVPIGEAVQSFWADLGMGSDAQRAGFAARVLAAGRRDRSRVMLIQTGSSNPRSLELPSLYAVSDDRPGIEAREVGSNLEIRINDALGNSETITDFDAAMSRAQPDQRIILDLRNTPSGGNTVVARAILGWFVSHAESYQVHELPVEERQSGIARRWIEQVLPRRGKHHVGSVVVMVGRWTGSMGEGLAIGFDAIGGRVVGTRMAGLRGAIYDHRLMNSGLVLKLPTEKLLTVDAIPREDFIPDRE